MRVYNQVIETDKYSIHFYIENALLRHMSKDETPPFEYLLGETSELRLIEKLLSMPAFEFSITELAQTAGLSRLSTYRALRKFEEWALVSPLSRGKRTRYQLNSESRIVHAFYDFNHALIEHLTGETETLAEQETMEASISPRIEIEYLQTFSGSKLSAEALLIQGISPPKPILKVATA